MGKKFHLLAKLDRELTFRWRHFFPQFLQIGLYFVVVGVLAEGESEPAISGGQVMRRA